MKNFKKINGVAMLPLVLLIGGLITVIALTITLTSSLLNHSSAAVKWSSEALAGAQAGVEDGIMQIIRNNSHSGTSTLAIGNANVTVIVSSSIPVSGKDTITSCGVVRSSQRKLQAVVNIDAITGQVNIESIQEIAIGESCPSASPWACGQSITDSRDSKTYATVQIGTQCWMKQGLNIGTRIAGGTGQGTDCSSASAIQKYCYSDTDANCNSNNNPNYPDGGLYQWNQAMCGSTTPGVKGICPTGWHFATDAEWTTLTTYLGGTIVAGGKLKPGGTSGFEGNLAGYRDTAGSFNYCGVRGYFWSSTQKDATFAWIRILYSVSDGLTQDGGDKAGGFSVRCLKD